MSNYHIPILTEEVLNLFKPVKGKIIIDATKQFPEEGGPASWASVSRTVLEEHCPEAFDLVDGKWSEYFES